MHLACGLSVGLTGLAAGYTIGIVGDMGVRSYMQQSRIFVGMVLILIFGEVLGLYGSVHITMGAIVPELTYSALLLVSSSTPRAEVRIRVARSFCGHASGTGKEPEDKEHCFTIDTWRLHCEEFWLCIGR